VIPLLTSGLGNRLFQFAAAAGLAERLGRPVAFSLALADCQACPHGPTASLFRLFPGVPLLAEGALAEGPTLREAPRRHYEYEDLDPASAASAASAASGITTGPTYIQGFRQNPRYFPPGGLHPNWDSALGGPAVRRWLERDAALLDGPEKARTVSLHVRLGDYRKLPHHQQDLAKYWSNALEKVPQGARLHLFSDEPDLCRAQFADVCTRRGLQFTVARVRSDLETLYEMSLCLGGNITANSTFSWWGAYFAHLAGSPWATYPSRWGKGMPDPAGIVPSWGELIAVD
jgi:hypothetical protein